MTADLVVVQADKLADLIRAAVESALAASDKSPAAKRGPRLLSARDVRQTYHIGKDALRDYCESGRLPFVTRVAPGGKAARFFRPEDCARVLADTLHRF